MPGNIKKLLDYSWQMISKVGQKLGENMTGADKEILDDYDQESSSDDSQADFHAKMLDIHKDLDQKN